MPRPSSEMKGLSKVDSYQDFPKETKWSQKIFFYEAAAEVLNKTRKHGEVRPLAAFFIYYSDGVGVVVDSGIGNGGRARVVLGEPGNYSLAKEEVESVEEAEKLAQKLGQPLADASVLSDTAFIEKHRGETLVFSSRNPSALSEEEFREGYYSVGVGGDEIAPEAGSLTGAIDAELRNVQARRADIKEEDGRLAKREKELIELKPKAEKADNDEARAEELIKDAEDSKKTIVEVLRRST